MTNKDFLIPRPLMCVLTHTSTVCYLEYLTGGRRCGRQEMSWAAELIRLKMNSTFQSGNIRHKLGEREEVERRKRKVGIGQIKPSEWCGVAYLLITHLQTKKPYFISILWFHLRLLLFKAIWVGSLSWVGATWPQSWGQHMERVKGWSCPDTEDWFKSLWSKYPTVKEMGNSERTVMQ